MERQRLGVLTGGSLLDGLEMKLDAGVSPEDLRAGQYVVLTGQPHLFYTMIDDVRLLSASPKIPVRPPGDGDLVLKEVLRGESTYVTIHLRPLLQIPEGAEGEEAVANAQVKTVPSHFTVAWRASEEDVARVFGDQAAADRWHVGQPLDMTTPICLNLSKFVERSNGVFGKTGTGKTFLTRLVLFGLMHKCPGEVVTLVFDMHNEYGNDARQEGKTVKVKGLHSLFPGCTKIYTLDRRSTEGRGGRWDEELALYGSDIEPSDIAAMREELGLSEAGCDTVGLVHDRYGGKWLEVLLTKEPSELAEELGAHEGALQAARRKLAKLRRLDFLTIGPRPQNVVDATDKMVTHLAHGQHVMLEFGRVASLLAYLLVANVVTRRIHAEWVEKAEHYHATQHPADKPPQLVIAVEEAHKFLNPEAARQTSFGQIARELRKYFVSLLVVDQRPSGIDDEILSQLGTRITAQLNDDRDIQAVLAGTTGSAGLKVVLAGLDSKQQALVFGHAVPMPVVLRVRPYDEELYRDLATVRSLYDADVNATMTSDPPVKRPTAW